MHSSLVNHFDWSEAHVHCEIGYRLLKDFEPLSGFEIPILYHHTPWQELKEMDISPHHKQMANLIFVSDRVDVMSASHYESDILLAKDAIVQSILNYHETYFDSAIVEAFCQVEKSESFWISLENRHVTRYTWDMGQFETSEHLTIAQLKHLSIIMAYIVDQKSPFTAQHSVRVACLAHYLAETL